MSKYDALIEEYVASLPIPGDSPSISGVFLEQIIPGYRTIGASGRFSLSSDINERDNFHDWSKYKTKRYQPKDFEISYAITCNNSTNLYNAVRKLNSFLHQKRKEFKLIFNNDPGIYYMGVVSNIAGEKLVNNSSISGSFVIHCADGRGYSVKEYEVNPIAKDGAYVFDFEYNGTIEAYPILEAKTRNAAGTGFIGFLTEEGKIIQVGDPKATQNSGNSVINKSFQNADVTGWSRNTYTPKPNGTERVFTSSGTVKATGVGMTIDSAGSGANNHGPCYVYDFSSNAAQNFSAELMYVLNMNAGSNNVGGGIEFIVTGHDDGSSTEYEVARISVYKKDNKTSAARIDCWVDGKVVDSKEFKMEDPASNLYTGSSVKIN